jgi:hypothetical protein
MARLTALSSYVYIEVYRTEPFADQSSVSAVAVNCIPGAAARWNPAACGVAVTGASADGWLARPPLCKFVAVKGR